MDSNRPNPASSERRAVALRYDRAAGEVPRVVASARAWMAEQMLALAASHDVPIRRDTDLLALLSHCETGEEIPPELYAAVAQVLVWLKRCDGEFAERGERAAAGPDRRADP